MNGITELAQLLQQMRPELAEPEYVFLSLQQVSEEVWRKLQPIASFVETEGTTLVCTKPAAVAAGFAIEQSYACITLTVHSSLEAVGLTAAVSNQLAKHEISANVIAAYYHDHVFVPYGKRDAAIAALRQLSQC